MKYITFELSKPLQERASKIQQFKTRLRTSHPTRYINANKLHMNVLYSENMNMKTAISKERSIGFRIVHNFENSFMKVF